MPLMIECPKCKNKAEIITYGNIITEDQHIYDNRKTFIECPECGRHTDHYPVDYYSEPDGYNKLLIKMLDEFLVNDDCTK